MFSVKTYPVIVKPAAFCFKAVSERYNCIGLTVCLQKETVFIYFNCCFVPVFCMKSLVILT